MQSTFYTNFNKWDEQILYRICLSGYNDFKPRQHDGESYTICSLRRPRFISLLSFVPYKLGKCYRAQCQRLHWSHWGTSRLSTHLFSLVGLRGPHKQGLYNTKSQAYHPSFKCAWVVITCCLSTGTGCPSYILWAECSCPARVRVWLVSPVICNKIFFHRCAVHFEFYIVHSPKNALFIDLVKSFIYIKIHNNIAPTCFGLNDHHQGALSVPD